MLFYFTLKITIKDLNFFLITKIDKPLEIESPVGFIVNILLG